MKKPVLSLLVILVSLTAAFSQASSTENLKRATAKEIGNNTRTDDVSVSNIKRKITSVTWNAQANGICYECDADDMVRSIHIVKIDCSRVPAEKKKSELPGGATIGNTKGTSGTGEAECAKYRKMRTVGIGLSVAGGATFLTSVILLAVGSHISYDSNGFPYKGSEGAYVAGAVLIVPGILATGAGIPLAIIGSGKAKKSCAEKASLNLDSGCNGLGLALSF
jgi:hypothetical protein